MVRVTYQDCSHRELAEALEGLADGQDDDMGQLLTEAARRIRVREFRPLAPVRFTYLHGETADGIVSSVNDRNVFVKFLRDDGTVKPQAESCDPERLTRR